MMKPFIFDRGTLGSLTRVPDLVIPRNLLYCNRLQGFNYEVGGYIYTPCFRHLIQSGHFNDRTVPPQPHYKKNDEAVEIDSGLEDSYRQGFSRTLHYRLLC